MAQRTKDGFPSKLESSVYQILLLRQRAGEISDIKRQQCVYLTYAQISWKVDFSFVELSSGETVYVEAKGIETSDYRIKKKLWKYYGPSKLEIWKGSYKNPILDELITPI